MVQGDESRGNEGEALYAQGSKAVFFICFRKSEALFKSLDALCVAVADIYKV